MAQLVVNTGLDDEIIKASRIFDKNNSGYISSNELRYIIAKNNQGLSDNQINNLIFEADVNEDGQINFEDFARMLSIE
jgi:Ca2+-binding EF-hand superfamily protein